MPQNDCDVLVIGAGAAGLAALQILDRAGLRVMVLEARDRVGGRIFTVHDPLSAAPLELGAEFIHGRPPELWEPIREAGLTVYDGTDKSHYMKDGETEPKLEADPVDLVMADMREAAKGGDVSFSDFLDTTPYSEDTKQAARGYIEGFNAADSNKISIRALAEETAAADKIDGDQIFRFSAGYDALTLHMLKSVPDSGEKLRLNSVTEQIHWSAGAVCVEARSTLTNRVQEWRAKRAVVTVPLGVLQARSIEFFPEPEDILNAARQLCFGQVYRVVLRFREAFWENREELKDVGFLFSRQGSFPTWWTTLARRSTVLTGWSAGTYAESLRGLPRGELLDRALVSLARITGFPANTLYSQLEAMYFHDWHSDVYARGAYSYVPVDALDAREQLACPVRETLYFAGEATDQNGHSATVHGAIASGRRAALQVLSSGALMAGG